MQMKNHHIKDQKKKQTSDGRKQATKNVYRQTDALTPGPLCHQSENALERFRFTIYIPDVHQYDMSSWRPCFKQEIKAKILEYFWKLAHI